MVLSTSDPDALDEVWFVLSKALGSSNNSDIRQSLKYPPARRSLFSGWPIISLSIPEPVSTIPATLSLCER